MNSLITDRTIKNELTYLLHCSSRDLYMTSRQFDEITVAQNGEIRKILFESRARLMTVEDFSHIVIMPLAVSLKE